MSGINRLAIIISFVIIVGLAFWPIQMVNVTLPKENNSLIAAVRVGDDDMIILTYRHSVELTTVEGRFIIGPESEILAVETRMESVGTGLPNTFPERTKIEDGWLVVDEGQRPVGPIRFFIVPINQSRLTIAGRSIDLMNMKAGILVQVSAEKLFMISWLWRAAAGI